MIVILVGLICVAGTYGAIATDFDAYFNTMSQPRKGDLGKTTTDRIQETYSLANREEIREEKTTSSLFLNKLKEVYKFDSLGRPQKIEERAYLLVKTLKHRNKRYSSYLTLCHFKICNMGRKRNTRYKSFNDMENDLEYYK
ncbi:uncharacterized protein LOC109595540 [Aethina tumida]|uniref:uncharacterized protein LOC109595540 n=1 Tax=Aethina tumida TaxID=116153 RepID=UPI002148FC06|nr:uncharacterized protein LOC109595540 [Aethina tumida]